MEPSAPKSQRIAFDRFEVDLRSGELRKNGRRVRLQAQPFQLLALLLEHPGEVVTREEVCRKLWDGNTFVDFDHSLGTAINKIREALGDSAEQPQFVETLPRRGYRFIVPVKNLENSAVAVHPQTEVPSTIKLERSSRLAIWLAVLASLALILVGLVVKSRLGKIFGKTSALPIHSIAVLPLENFSGDPDQDYFADGMTDELITMLAKNASLRVISRTSAMHYKGVHRPLPDIARELGVDGILEGSVARSGTRMHLTIQLIHAPSDTHVWAESYDRELGDAVSLAKELAQTIAKQLKSTSPPVGPQRYINSEAHDAYLRGRYYWFSGAKNRGRECFQKAIDLQPDYAAAWSGLADYYVGGAVSEVLPPEVMPQGEVAALKALELDDSLPEAHNSMAAAFLFYRWNWERADSESARAIELNPSYAEAHHLRSYVLGALNRMYEALHEQEKSTELDPFARPWALGYALIRAHQFDAALNEARLRFEAQPNDFTLRALLSDAYRFKRMETESVQELEKLQMSIGDKESADAVRRAFDQGGYKAVLEWQLSDLKKKAAKEYVSPTSFAHAYARLRLKDETIRYLEEAYRKHAPRLVYIQNEPDFDFVHTDQRYRAIVRRMGLPPAF